MVFLSQCSKIGVKEEFPHPAVLSPFAFSVITSLISCLVPDHYSATMSQTGETSHGGATIEGDTGAENAVVPKLYNDVYFERQKSFVIHDSWPPFLRLPAELRLQIWLAALRRHRMIELGLGVVAPNGGDEGDDDGGNGDYDNGDNDDGDNDDDPGGNHDEDNTTDSNASRSPRSPYYTQHNRLGNLISGGNYMLILDNFKHIASLRSPLFQVNSEARQLALEFYRVHLPFPQKDSDHILYLNPDYDVLYIWPTFGENHPMLTPRSVRPVAVLIDFLHDVRAYDPDGKGFVNS